MTRPLRLLFLCYYCPPAGGSAVQRPEMLLRYAPPDVEITVITAAIADYEGFSPLSTPLDPERFTPCQSIHRLSAGRSYKVFRLLAGVRLYGLVRWLYRPDIARRWARAACRLARELHAGTPFDAVLSVAPPFSVALAGRDSAQQLRIPWISDLGDLWTDYLRGVWPSRWHHRYERRLERTVIEQAAVTVMCTPGSREMMLRKYPFLPSHRVQYITWGFDPARFPSRPEVSPDRFVIVYPGVFCGPKEPAGVLRRCIQGRFFEARPADLNTDSPIDLVRAMELLRDPRIEFRHIGPAGAENLKLFRSAGVRGQIKTLGYLNHKDAMAELHRSDAAYLCLTTVLDQPRNEQVPQKTYEYLGARKPVLAPIQDGDAKDYLLASGLGICTPPRDPSALAAALRSLVEAKFAGRSLVDPREDFIRRFEWNSLAGRFFDIVDKAVSAPAMPSFCMSDPASAQNPVSGRSIPGVVPRRCVFAAQRSHTGPGRPRETSRC